MITRGLFQHTTSSVHRRSPSWEENKHSQSQKEAAPLFASLARTETRLLRRTGYCVLQLSGVSTGSGASPTSTPSASLRCHACCLAMAASWPGIFALNASASACKEGTQEEHKNGSVTRHVCTGAVQPKHRLWSGTRRALPHLSNFVTSELSLFGRGIVCGVGMRATPKHGVELFIRDVRLQAIKGTEGHVGNVGD